LKSRSSNILEVHVLQTMNALDYRSHVSLNHRYPYLLPCYMQKP